MNIRGWLTLDIWLYLLLVIAVVVILTNIPTAVQRRRAATRLANVERKVVLIMEHFGIEDPEPYLPEVIAFLEQGKKIPAIKAYRDATAVGLKEAKEAVEQMARSRGLEIR